MNLKNTLLGVGCIAMATVCAMSVSGCSGQSDGSKAPAGFKAPEILGWYTTTTALPRADGVIRLNQDPDNPKIFLVVEVQFPGKLLWVKTDKTGMMQYERQLTDARVRLAGNQTFPAVAHGPLGSKEWSQGPAYTDTPSDSNSKVKLAFVMPDGLVEQSGMKLEYRDVPPMELSQGKRIAAGAP